MFEIVWDAPPSGAVLVLVIVIRASTLMPTDTCVGRSGAVPWLAAALAVVGIVKGMTEMSAVARRARDQGECNMTVHCRASPSALHRRHLSSGR